MKTDCHRPTARRISRRSRQAVALLVWLGVLAVLAILAAFLLPALIRELDARVARDESALLQTLGNALQSAVQRQASIPAGTNWAEMVAAEAAMATPSVANNPRGQPRLLLMDRGGWLNSTALPYSQTDAGTTNAPVQVRMMIASSLGLPLPLTNGLLSASEFSALWKAAEGTTNFPTTGLWAGWSGRPDDVKLERVDLSPLFVSLRVLTYARPEPQGQYSIGTNTTLHQAPYRDDRYPPPAAYYLQTTLLKLYTDAGNLDSTQILNEDGSFMYENGVWRGASAGGSLPGGIDIAGVVYAFLNSVPNTRAHYGDNQQKLVVQSMMNYMSNYIAWADGGFTDANLKSYLLNTAQPAMVATFQDIFQGVYYPTNASGPQ